MRQIFTSARSENVDRVVALLEEAGIETTVTNRRAYAGHDYMGPSYTSKVEQSAWPQVWVVHSADQTRAREILREIGIAPATRFAEEVAQSRATSAAPSSQQRRYAFLWHPRTLLLGAIALIALLNWLGVLHFF